MMEDYLTVMKSFEGKTGDFYWEKVAWKGKKGKYRSVGLCLIKKLEIHKAWCVQSVIYDKIIIEAKNTINEFYEIFKKNNKISQYFNYKSPILKFKA